MYPDVTSQVNSQLGQGFYADPAFMTRLDVTFANLYFAAADMAGNPAARSETAPAGALLINRGLWRRSFRKPMTFLRYRGIAGRLGGWRRYCARS
jgi:hypothetical protein